MNTSTRFDLLRKSQRREVLLALIDQEAPDIIVHDGGGLDIDATYSGACKLQLEHCHLPKLAEHNVIVWDRETNTITKGSQFGAIEALLRVSQNEDNDVPNG
ncbi:hypothetical protein [Halomicrococcus sp. NG-SE-24]|uniref:hypothetical protein n=1 Tax=Halomicrococcus sp. NG-SE-24 TaxID=3436928 RepID=UPI003D98C88E